MWLSSKVTSNLPLKQKIISNILREELADIETDITLQDKIFKELIEEVNEYLIQQFEDEQSYLSKIEDASDVFCPICQKSTLERNNKTLYSCVCGIS